MKISLWAIGKNHEPYIKEGTEEFTKRISRYFSVEWNIIPAPKNAAMLSEMDLRKKEAEQILQWLQPGDFLIALDEKGKQLTSEGLAHLLQTRTNESTKNIVFLIGGAFGLDSQILSKANFVWSLSQ